MTKTEYSIVIPAYNESDKISTSLNQIISFMRSFSPSFEVIVSDDGSTDNTVGIVEEISKNNEEIQVIKNEHRGKGYAVYSGVTSSTGEFVYIADADLSAPINEVKKLSVWIKDHNFDIVIGSREGTGATRINEPFYRHLMGRVFNYLVQTLALPGIKDSQCGFKLFRGAAARDIFSRLKIYGEDSPIINQPFVSAYDVEVLYIARKLKYKIREVPVVWTYVKTSRLHPFRDSIKMGLDVVKIRLNDLRGVYKSPSVE